jgi:predicted lipoprotein
MPMMPRPALTRLTLTLALALVPLAAAAGPDRSETIDAILDVHVLPGFARLEAETGALAGAAQADCAPTSPPLRDAYDDAFDAWMGVSHLRFGPTETGNRAYALAYWPDTRGATPKALKALLRGGDPALNDPDAFAMVSVAARGFYALELLLYDPGLGAGAADADTLCALIRAGTADIHRNAAAILDDWETSQAEQMRRPGPDSPYKDQREVMQTFFGALIEGLKFDEEVRLGRPLGSFDRPRPERAEAWRSGRSLRNLELSLEAERALADLMAGAAPDSRDALLGAFDRALETADTLDDPVFAGVADPEGRLRVEILQQQIRAIVEAGRADLGPALGVAAGFNSLDGD